MAMNPWELGTDPQFGATPQLNMPEVETNWYDDILNDQNVIRGLGETGAAISSGTPIGQAVGQGASNLVRRKQVQKAAGQARQQNQTFQQRMMQAIMDGRALSPPDQNDAFDSATISTDGMSFKMKNTPQPQQFMGEQSQLESYDPQGGSDLPDFL